MIKFLKKFLAPKFKAKKDAKFLADKWKYEVAFQIGGVKYYHFVDELGAPTGRQMAALAIYEEMNMRCSRDYLIKHCQAMNKIFEQKQISMKTIITLNNNLEERLELMQLPEFVYKLASVIYFDDKESPYMYDYEYAKEKIARWKEAGGTLDFFSKTPLAELIPSLRLPEQDLKNYFQVSSLLDGIHQKHLTDVLSEKE